MLVTVNHEPDQPRQACFPMTSGPGPTLKPPRSSRQSDLTARNIASATTPSGGVAERSTSIIVCRIRIDVASRNRKRSKRNAKLPVRLETIAEVRSRERGELLSDLMESILEVKGLRVP